MIKFELNGKQVEIDDSLAAKPLLWVIREDLGFTGTKYGCGMAQCGACTIQLNGNATRSCVLPVSAASGQKITTIENSIDPILEATKSAWQELNVVQCGYCQSGQILAAAALLKNNANPSDAAIGEALNGNVCRCVTYQRILAATKKAAETIQKRG